MLVTQDDNLRDDPGRTDGTSETQLMLRQGGDVVRQEFEEVVVGQQEFEEAEVVDVGQLTPQRHKKRAVGKKLTPKKKKCLNQQCVFVNQQCVCVFSVKPSSVFSEPAVCIVQKLTAS